MRALRSVPSRPWRNAALVPGLAASFLVLSGQSIAYQDLTSHLIQRSGVEQTWRRHVKSLVRPSMAMAGFALPRPSLREGPLVLASLSTPADALADPRRAGRAPGPALGAGMDRGLIYPLPDRTRKGDLVLVGPALRPSLGQATPSLLEPPRDLGTASRFAREAAAEVVDTEHSPLALGGVTLASLDPGALPDEGAPVRPLSPQAPADGAAALKEAWETSPPAEPGPAEERAGITIGGNGPMARASAGLGAPPIPVETVPFRIAATHEPVAGFDPILSEFAADRRGDRPDPALAKALRALPEPAPAVRPAVTGHPAVTLGLSGQALARAERCLAEAIYWEARSEVERGQMAVAQVVVNRAVSGFYPRDICGVVYQNAHRYLACQFTFACEGRRSLAPTEAGPWAMATRIARDTLAGRLWLPDVGHATHYHATYVRPWWARRMNRLQQIGVHVFYRPRQWADGPQVRLARSAPGEG